MWKLCILLFFGLASAIGQNNNLPNPRASPLLSIPMKVYVVIPANALQVKSLKLSLEYLQNSLDAQFYVRTVDIQVGKQVEILVPDDKEARFKHSIMEIGAHWLVKFNKAKLSMYNVPTGSGNSNNNAAASQDNNAVIIPSGISYPNSPHPRDFLTPEAIAKQIKSGCVGSGKKSRGEVCSYHGECCSGMCYHGPNHPNVYKCGGVSAEPKAQNSQDNPHKLKAQSRDQQDESSESVSDSSSSEGN